MTPLGRSFAQGPSRRIYHSILRSIPGGAAPSAPITPLEREATAPEALRIGLHVLVLGGGASGVLMAAHLLAQKELGYRVTLVEGRNLPGKGIAYSTVEPDHLLNTRAHNMSAWPEAPHHFEHWLRNRPDSAGVTGQCFVSRATYGAYLTSLIEPWLDPAAELPQRGRLRFLPQACLELIEDDHGINARLADGRVIRGDLAVLATGHVLPGPDPKGLLSEAWGPPEGLDPDAQVVILGTGLSMVDQVLSLQNRGHRGKIIAVSRRGQLPRAHSDNAPLALSYNDLPPAAPLSGLMRWLRKRIREAEAVGGTWRDVVDGLRVHAQDLWRDLDQEARARFLRHAAIWWDVHRHRIPTESGARIDAALASGQLEILRGAYVTSEQREDGQLNVLVRPHGKAGLVGITGARITDCRGIRRDPGRNAAAPIAGLLARGAARLDPLAIGLDLGRDCRIRNADGTASQRIYAIGPVSRAAFWEITAIPDIRVQVAKLARDFSKLPLSAVS